MNPVTMQLDSPITLDGKEITTIILREPRVKDELSAARISKTPEDKEVNFLGEISGLGGKAIAELTLADYRRLQLEAAVFFLPVTTSA